MTKNKSQDFSNLIDKVQDENVKNILVGVVSSIDDRVEDAYERAYEDAQMGGGRSQPLTDAEKTVLKDQQRVDKMRQIWDNNGYIPGTKGRLELSDLFAQDVVYKQRMLTDGFSTDHPNLIPRVISNIVREAMEPAQVLTPMFQKIAYPNGTHITFPSVGAIHAADIPEGGEYPERELELEGEVNAVIGKSGVAVKMTEEMVRYSIFDLMGLVIRGAGKALTRHKEQKCADQILASTNVQIDNTAAAVQSSTGRDAAGNYNGTLTLDDLHRVYGSMVDTGYVPDTLIMHPLAWQIFSNEGIARAFGFENGISSYMWQLAQGSLGYVPQWAQSASKLNNLGAPTNVGNVATTHTTVPQMFPWQLKVVVSPWMTFDSSTSRTTLALVDSSRVGVLVVDEEVTTDQWDDPSKDIMKIKFRERYALADIEQGKAVCLAKDIFVGDRSVDFLDKLVYQVTGQATGFQGNALSEDDGFQGNV